MSADLSPPAENVIINSYGTVRANVLSARDVCTCLRCRPAAGPGSYLPAFSAVLPP